MPRTKKTETTTAAEGMSMILDTPVLKTVSEGAEFVGCAEIRLLELFSDALSLSEALGWETIPQEHEHLLNEFKAQASANTQVLPETVQPPVEVAQAVSQAPSEPPVVEDEPKPAKKRGKKSTALTAPKTEAIEQTKEETKETAKGINETLTLLQAQEAIVDSSQDATTYLATYATNLTNLKGEGLSYFAAQSLQKISNSSGFNPQEIMKQVGVQLSDETKAKLNETMGQVLGKSHAAAQEILQTTWGNGYNLQAELSQLENLMNSDD